MDNDLEREIDEAYVKIQLKEYLESYENTGNPIHVWQCIQCIENNKLGEYPEWIRKYLLRTADNLKKCDRKAKGMNGIVSAFGFAGAHQLYVRDEYKVAVADAYIVSKISGDYDWDDGDDEISISDGKKSMSIENAALEAERYLNENGLQKEADAGKRGYLGVSKLEKIYRATERQCEEIRREGLARLRENMNKKEWQEISDSKKTNFWSSALKLYREGEDKD